MADRNSNLINSKKYVESCTDVIDVGDIVDSKCSCNSFNCRQCGYISSPSWLTGEYADTCCKTCCSGKPPRPIPEPDSDGNIET